MVKSCNNIWSFQLLELYFNRCFKYLFNISSYSGSYWSPKFWSNYYKIFISVTSVLSYFSNEKNFCTNFSDKSWDISCIALIIHRKTKISFNKWGTGNTWKIYPHASPYVLRSRYSQSLRPSVSRFILINSSFFYSIYISLCFLHRAHWYH